MHLEGPGRRPAAVATEGGAREIRSRFTESEEEVPQLKSVSTAERQKQRRIKNEEAKRSKKKDISMAKITLCGDEKQRAGDRRWEGRRMKEERWGKVRTAGEP